MEFGRVVTRLGFGESFAALRVRLEGVTEEEGLFGREEVVPAHGDRGGGTFPSVGDELGGTAHRVGNPADEVGAASASSGAFTGDEGGDGDGVQGWRAGGGTFEPGRAEAVPARLGPVADGDECGGA